MQGRLLIWRIYANTRHLPAFTQFEITKSGRIVEEKEKNAILCQGMKSKQLILIQFAHWLYRLSLPLNSTVVKIFTFFSKRNFSPVWYVMTNRSWAASKGFYRPPSHHPLHCFFHRSWRRDDETVSHACIRTSVFCEDIDRMHAPAPNPNLT